jgi:hypothetical protein
MEIVFPLGGLERSLAYQAQRPYTAYDLLNVRPRDTIERRLRGGSRPGLRKAYSNIMGIIWAGDSASSFVSYSSTTGLSLVNTSSPKIDRNQVGSFLTYIGYDSFIIDSFNTTSSCYVRGNATGMSYAAEILRGAPVQTLAVVHPIPTDSTTLPPAATPPFTIKDGFDVEYLDSSSAAILQSPQWSTLSTFTQAPTPLPAESFAYNKNAAQCAAVYQQIPSFNTSGEYTVWLTCDTTNLADVSAANRVGMVWSVFAKLNNSSPTTANGIRAYLAMTAVDATTGNNATFQVDETVASVTTSRTVACRVEFNGLTFINITVNGSSVVARANVASGLPAIGWTTALSTSSYDRVGFGVGNTSSTSYAALYTRAKDFFITGTLTVPAAFSGTAIVGGQEFRPKMLVGIAGGRLYREKTPGLMSPIGTEEGVLAAGSSTTAIVLANTTFTNTDLTAYTIDFLGAYVGISRRINSYVTGTQTATVTALAGSPAAGEKYRIRRDPTVQEGQVSSATSTTIVFDDTSLTRHNLLTWKVQIIAGTGKGQERTLITSYNAGTQTGTVASWDTTPDSTSRYRIFPGYAPAQLRFDGTPLMAVELRGKLYIADYDIPKFTATNASVNGTALTHSEVSGQPAPDFNYFLIDTRSDLVVLTDGAGSATNANYTISTVASATSITLGSSASSGASACNVRVQRAPKVYNPIADTLILIASSAGQHPVGCPMIERYRDRLVLAGYPQQFWAMSRQGTPLDWNYGATDDQRAVAGVAGNAGVIPEPLTSILNGNDDFFLFGCEQSLFALKGEPTSGTLVQISNTVGIIDRMARCHTPDGSVVFLARDGLYRLFPGATGVEPLTKRTMPKELVRIDTSKYWVTMCYDAIDQGVHVYVTPYSATEDATHWWFDYTDKTPWRVVVPTNMDVFSMVSHDIVGNENSVVMLGCRDGFIRRFHDEQLDDDGETLDSYALCGPIRLNVNDREGVIKQMIGTLAVDSDDVDWSLQLGKTPEGALDATEWPTGTWVDGVDGLNYNDAVRASGAVAFLKLASTGRWAFERASVALKPGGAVRKR